MAFARYWDWDDAHQSDCDGVSDISAHSMNAGLTFQVAESTWYSHNEFWLLFCEPLFKVNNMGVFECLSFIMIFIRRHNLRGFLFPLKFFFFLVWTWFDDKECIEMYRTMSLINQHSLSTFWTRGQNKALKVCEGDSFWAKWWGVMIGIYFNAPRRLRKDLADWILL